MSVDEVTRVRARRAGTHGAHGLDAHERGPVERGPLPHGAEEAAAPGGSVVVPPHTAVLVPAGHDTVRVEVTERAPGRFRVDDGPAWNLVRRVDQPLGGRPVALRNEGRCPLLISWW